MTDNQDENQEVSWEELAYSNMIQNEAFLRLLVKKGFITQQEFMDEAQEVHREYQRNVQGH